jgi:tRNA pseudouridine55 synthase
MTSFDVIDHCKKLCQPYTTVYGSPIKIGHAGTLDPFASGVLIVGFGKALKSFHTDFLTCDKTYEVTAQCGLLTDTLDHTGSHIQKEHVSDHVCNNIKKVIASFKRSYAQTPPLYSALKYKGKPLYEYARNNLIPLNELHNIARHKSRHVNIYELTLISCDAHTFSYKAHVSSGTYIRALSNDIAQRAGTYATTIHLKRTSVGAYSINQAHPLKNLQSYHDISAKIILPD